MAITAHVALYRCAFHGLRAPTEPDWPPSPRRLLGALLAGAYGLPGDGTLRATALTTLRRLSASSPPVIDAPQSRPLHLPGTYTQNTWLPETRGAKQIGQYLDLTLLDINTGSRTAKPQDGVALASRVIDYHIALDCTPMELHALDAAARRIPYFGTSRDPAELSVTTADPEQIGDPPRAPLVRWYPHEETTGPVHSWQPNTISWFEANYQRIFGRDPALNQLPPISPAGFVRMLSYTTSRAVEGGHIPIVALARSLPHHRIPGLIGPINHELAAKESVWRAFAVTVSHEAANTAANGDGRCVGVGLVMASPPPTAQATGSNPLPSASDAVQIVARIVGRRHDDGLVVGSPRALLPKTWRGPASRWYSTTPLRAFPDQRIVRYVMAQQVREQYGARVTGLELSRAPRIARGGRWSNGDLSDGLDQWWAEIKLSKQVAGPLLLGAATERGFGTFRPRTQS